MKNPIKSFLDARAGLSTYKLGLIQAKAYRILKTYTTKLLKQYQLSTLDWALLGWLYDSKNGVQFKEIADMLGVEAPFVTVLIEELGKKELVQVEASSTDKRSKNVALTTKGKRLVPVIEKNLRDKTRVLLKGTSAKDMYAYLKVLESIVSNDPSKNE